MSTKVNKKAFTSQQNQLRNKSTNFMFKIKSIPEDFVVSEIPLSPNFAVKKRSQYTYLNLKKRGLSTFDALETIKNHFNLDYSEVNAAGLKDEEAVTTQTISIKKLLTKQDLTVFNKSYAVFSKSKSINIKLIGYSLTPVVERDLHGNCFKIVVRNLSSETAKKLIRFCRENRFVSFVNYYDEQRFGMPGGPYNTHKIGESVVSGDFKKAFREYEISQKDTILTKTRGKYLENPREWFLKINPNKIRFFVSSYNSSLWNKVASATVAGLNESLTTFFPNLGTLQTPKKRNFKSFVSCSSPAYRLVEETLSVEKGVKERDLVITTAVYTSDAEKDEMFSGKNRLTFSFFLPTGSYATMLIKQLIIWINFNEKTN